MKLIDGLELLDHDTALLADGYEHPNERGCRQIAMRLNGVIRIPSLRPSSVGKRRKRKGKPKASGKSVARKTLPSLPKSSSTTPDLLQLPLDELL